MPRAFAIVPAAGRSERMGRPKLLFPWGKSSVIETVLATWHQTSVAATVVVVHPDDTQLAEVCRQAGAEVVVPPEVPPDMKASVRYGLEAVALKYKPGDNDLWALAPADMPWLPAAIVDQMIAAMDETGATIVVPTHAGRRGHPVLFRWSLGAEVSLLAENEGVSELLNRHKPAEFAWPDDSILGDLDTPDDLDAARRLRRP
ncbi:MAG: nucleotidyltransferase family protein [Pirellulales bacterium]